MLVAVPQELFTAGGVGTTCASLMQFTVALPGAGVEIDGGVTVYVYIHCPAAPEQSVYVHVYVFVPEQTGSGPITGPVGVIGFPHESSTLGGVGTTWASEIQETVALPGAGSVNVGEEMVYVYTHCALLPEQFVYVQV